MQKFGQHFVPDMRTWPKFGQHFVPGISGSLCSTNTPPALRLQSSRTVFALPSMLSRAFCKTPPGRLAGTLCKTPPGRLAETPRPLSRAGTPGYTPASLPSRHSRVGSGLRQRFSLFTDKLTKPRGEGGEKVQAAWLELKRLRCLSVLFVRPFFCLSSLSVLHRTALRR